MSTPINQLPPGQPVANDPNLVQQILKEAMPQDSPQPQPQPQPQLPPLKEYQRPMLSHPSYYPPKQGLDYMSMIKSLILVSALVFISQMPSLKDYISLYVPQNDLNLILRALLAGASYVGLDMVF